MGKIDFDAYQHRVSRKIVHAARSGGSLLSVMRREIDLAEQALAGSDEDFSLIACQAGCKSCCVVNVSVLFPEGLAIAGYLQQLPQDTLSTITERLDELWRAVRGLTDDERISLRQNCAFLDKKGYCKIYPVRPLLCRSVTSTSAENCRQALADHLFDESSPVLMNLFQRQLFEAVYLGVGDALEKSGLEGRSVKLTGLVRHLLKNPHTGVELLAGKRLDWHDLA